MTVQARRILGTLFGLALGLGYSLLTEYINVLFMPGVPLYEPWPGRITNLLLGIIGGALLGLLAAWPEEGPQGIIASALVLTFFSSIITVIGEASSPTRAFNTATLIFLTFLPRVTLLMPAALLVRWSVDRWEEETIRNPMSLRWRSISTALLVGTGLVLGWTALHPVLIRESALHLNGLIRAGQQAGSVEALPIPLHKVDGFLQRARGPYSMLIIDNPDEIPVTRPVVGYNALEPAIIVLFENGFRFGCVYTPPNIMPSCEDY